MKTSKNISKFDMSPTINTGEQLSRPSELAQTAKMQQLKDLVEKEKGSAKNHMYKPSNYISKVMNVERPKNQRIEMIQKKNIRRQKAVAQELKIEEMSSEETIKPQLEIPKPLEISDEIKIVKNQNISKTPRSIMINCKPSIRRRYQRESGDLRSINELTGEDTASMQSSKDQEGSLPTPPEFVVESD